MFKRISLALAVSSLCTPMGHAAAIEEVVVTATKREESMQSVPIAITAISADQLDRAGVKDLRDLGAVAPSFNMNSSTTESQGTTLRIRGVGTTGNNTGLESAVGVFLDGVYLSRPGVALVDLMDIEQVEVLRGPQGTLFGRNTSAGALNIRTKAPSFDGHSHFINLTAGNFSAYGIQAGSTGPVSDSVAYRVAAAKRKQDGFLESTTGAESRTRDRWTVRGQLLWEISPKADLRVIADYSEAEEECCDAVIIGETVAAELGSFAAAGLPADGGVQVSGRSAFEGRDSNGDQFENPFEQKGISWELNWQINDNVDFTYIGSWRDFVADSVQDSDHVSIDVLSLRPESANGFKSFIDIETTTHEFRFSGDTDRLSWMVGGYYSREELKEQGGFGLGADYTAHMDAILWNFAFEPIKPALALLADVPLATGGTFGDVLSASSPALAFAGGVDSAGSYAQNRVEQEGTAWSIFTHNTFRLTDTLDLVVGARWNDEEKDGKLEQLEAANGACLATLANAGALFAGASGTPLLPFAAGVSQASVGYACFPFATPALDFAGLPAEFDESYKDDELTYTGKLVWQPQDSVLLYVSYTHGYKAGGFNLDATAASGGADPTFDSEIIDSWEVGIKSDLLENRLRLNLTLFDYDMEDFQVLNFEDTRFVTFNVPNAEARGAELELLASPNEALLLSLAYTYSDANYPSDCDGGQDASALVSSLCGADLTNAPENVVTAAIDWDGQLTDRLGFFAHIDARYEDDRRTSTVPGVPFDIQDSNTKVNLRLGVVDAEGSWSLELWANNITDERTKNATFDTPLRIGSSSVFLEAPRTYGLTLRTNF